MIVDSSLYPLLEEQLIEASEKNKQSIHTYLHLYWVVRDVELQQIQSEMPHDPFKINRFLQDLKRGEEFPMITLIQKSDSCYEIENGKYRNSAIQKLNLVRVPCYVGCTNKSFLKETDQLVWNPDQ